MIERIDVFLSQPVILEVQVVQVLLQNPSDQEVHLVLGLLLVL